jgi:hypothetical protein
MPRDRSHSCSHIVPGLFPVAVAENSGHYRLFPVFPSIQIIGAHAPNRDFRKFAPTGNVGMLGTTSYMKSLRENCMGTRAGTSEVNSTPPHCRASRLSSEPEVISFSILPFALAHAGAPYSGKAVLGTKLVNAGRCGRPGRSLRSEAHRASLTIGDYTLLCDPAGVIATISCARVPVAT